MSNQGGKRRGTKPANKREPQVLGDHKRQGKLFVPPLMQLEQLHMVSWHRDMLPDFLWIGVMLGRRTDWQAARRPLAVLDAYVPAEETRVIDGRLSTFALVPEDRRHEAREHLRREFPEALPSALGHALCLFPSCPALWLYDEWLSGRKPDLEVGLNLLRTYIAEHRDKGGVRSTRLRMSAIMRLAVRGRFTYTDDPIIRKVPDYPSRLSEADQRLVESVMRACWGSLSAVEEQDGQPRDIWASDFWTRCRALAPCAINEPERVVPISDDYDDGPVDPEPLTHVSELKALLDEAQKLGARLLQQQLNAFSAPEADGITSVLLGLASRMYRLLVDFMERPSTWSPRTASFFLRPLIETRIVSAWLVLRNDPDLIAAYRAHGIGNLKLLRDHTRNDLGDSEDEQVRSYLEHLDDRVNFELDEWVQTVNVGAFSNTTIRQMAIDTDLKRLYDLTFAPMSSENHGEWVPVRDYDTTACTEPLHGGHRVGRFGSSPRVIGPEAIRLALEIATDGISAIFDQFQIDLSEEFNDLEAAFVAAMYSSEDEPAS
jgi:hypothetical protein